MVTKQTIQDLCTNNQSNPANEAAAKAASTAIIQHFLHLSIQANDDHISDESSMYTYPSQEKDSNEHSSLCKTMKPHLIYIMTKIISV